MNNFDIHGKIGQVVNGYSAYLPLKFEGELFIYEAFIFAHLLSLAPTPPLPPLFFLSALSIHPRPFTLPLP